MIVGPVYPLPLPQTINRQQNKYDQKNQVAFFKQANETVIDHSDHQKKQVHPKDDRRNIDDIGGLKICPFPVNHSIDNAENGGNKACKYAGEQGPGKFSLIASHMIDLTLMKGL
jgi:hypothetical protein